MNTDDEILKEVLEGMKPDYLKKAKDNPNSNLFSLFDLEINILKVIALAREDFKKRLEEAMSEVVVLNALIKAEKNKFGKQLAEQKAEILKIIDEARNTSGYVGIGEWRCNYDNALFQEFLLKLKQKLKEIK